jgi:cytochrome d ubiquinol oxidase subunit I
MHGLNTLEHQPVKLAAMEGLWETGRGVPATIIGWPDTEAETNRYEIAIPKFGSLYLTHSWDGEVKGLKSVPRADRPYVPVVFFAFRVMVGIGLLLLAVALTGGFLRWRRRLYDTRWFQLAAMGVMPLGFIAVLAGWTVTETGRQPYIVYGLLRTADAASPVTTGAVSASLALFVIVYNMLLLAFFWYGARMVLRGPGKPEGPARPGIDLAGPSTVGAPAGALPQTGG